MVLYYGLFALEAANNTIAATTAPTTTSTIPRTGSDRISLARQSKHLSNSVGKMPSSSTSSSNSWIYTEDLRKRFEERYADYRYIFVPVYIDRKSGRHSHSTTALISQTIDRDNSWIYTRSLRDHGFYSTSKMSLPLTTNISSSTCCVTNHGFMRDELPVKKDLKSRFFKRSLSVKDKRTSSIINPIKSTNISLSSLPFSHLTSSTSSFTTTTNNLIKHRTSDVVEEEDDEGVDNENHSIPLLKQDSTISSTARTTTIPSIDNNINADSIATTNEQTSSISTPSKTQSSMKHSGSHNKKLTRLRSFFFRTSSSNTQQQQQQQQQQKTTLSSSSSSNRISRT